MGDVRFVFGGPFQVCERDLVFVPEDMERPIEPPVDNDLVQRGWQRGFRSFQLDESSAQSDRVVVVDRSGCLVTEDVPEIKAGDGPVDITEMVGDRKSGVVLPEIDPLQEAVGLGNV